MEASRALDDEQKHRIRQRQGARVTAVAQDARSQARNRQLALERLRSRLEAALHKPKPRRPTRPGRAAKERRLQSKARRADVKRTRRRPGADDA